jgi:hypothetical protein
MDSYGVNDDEAMKLCIATAFHSSFKTSSALLL